MNRPRDPLPPWAAATSSLAGITIDWDAPLARWTTFQLGGPCTALVHCTSPEPLPELLAIFAAHRVRWRLLGGGSNLLVADEGIPEVVLRFADGPLNLRRDGDVLDVPAHAGLDDLAAQCARLGWDGFVFANGIPGTIGGAIAGNAGAFGDDIGSRVCSLMIADPAGRVHEIGPAQCGFRYRHSALAETGWVILRARLAVADGDPARLQAERERILALRRQKHPDWHIQPTAGSFYRNIEPTSAAKQRQAAGWFLEQAGAKTFREGGARVFERHANIIVADGPGCRAAHVHRLALRMAAAVRERFGIELIPEVRRWGEFDRPARECGTP
ncbi:MAG: FAD-binding protein [Kiritimatiellae bacterium]|nr:FAD-binding protein [Kiritimatiellia bacterium]